MTTGLKGNWVEKKDWLIIIILYQNCMLYKKVLFLFKGKATKDLKGVIINNAFMPQMLITL